MNDKILVTYQSVTGFTQQYARWIADALDCAVMDLRSVSAGAIPEHGTVIFGGRFHAGQVDGLKKAKELFARSAAERLVVFATGASPHTAADMIEQAWSRNLSPDESARIPHFYMPGGLRYEQMPLGDKLMMKVFAAMVKRKKDKSAYDTAMEQALASSYDLSSRDHIQPLVSCVLRGGTGR